MLKNFLTNPIAVVAYSVAIAVVVLALKTPTEKASDVLKAWGSGHSED